VPVIHKIKLHCYPFLLTAAKLIAMIVIACGKGYTEDSIPKIKSISLASGYSYLRMLDKQMSPLIYRAQMVPFSIGYCSKKEDRFFAVDINLIGGAIRSDLYKKREVIMNETDNEGVVQENKMVVGNLPVFQDEINLHYMRRIKTKSASGFNWFVGGVLKQYFSISMGLLMFVHSEFSLNPSAAVIYDLDRSRTISSSLSFPVISAITRFPYSNDPLDGKHNPFISTYVVGTCAATINKYQRINFNLMYKKQFDKWSTGAVYSFYWMHYSENRGLRAFDNCIELKVAREICKRNRSKRGRE
jgi:hypothetical protein